MRGFLCCGRFSDFPVVIFCGIVVDFDLLILYKLYVDRIMFIVKINIMTSGIT